MSTRTKRQLELIGYLALAAAATFTIGWVPITFLLVFGVHMFIAIPVTFGLILSGIYLIKFKYVKKRGHPL